MIDDIFDAFSDFDDADSSTNDTDDFNAFVDEPTVIESVENASTFFNIDSPADIHEDDSTGVYTRSPSTVNDDVLVYNSAQLESLGIDSGDGLDLVMTHESAHRALQNMGEEFSSHQEELCCDYLAGVRAGLNNMDTTSMENSLIHTTGSFSHPDGTSRISAIEHGKQFAMDYYAKNGTAPTLQECIEHFKQHLDEMYDVNIGLDEDYSLSPFVNNDDAFFNSDESIFKEQEHGFIDEHDDFKGFVDDRAYHLRKAQENKEWAEWHEKRAAEAISKGDLSAARDHNSRAATYRKAFKDCIEASKKCTK